MRSIKGIVPGMLIVLLIAALSQLVSLIHPSFDVLVLSIIFGMVISGLVKEKGIYDDGIAFALKIFLPAGIALYGTQLSVTGLDVKLWSYIIAIFALMFSLTYFIAKGLGLSKNLAILLSTGLSVCGASAIAVISPLIGAKKEELSLSVITVMVIGLAGMIFYPLLADFLILNKNEFAFLSGATLPMLGQVKASAASAGTEALAAALRIKLIRISFLIVLPLVILMISGKKEKCYVPWFIGVFIAFAIGVNLMKDASPVTAITAPASRFFLSSALASIGLSVELDEIAEEGAKPLAVAALSWGIVVLLLYLSFSIGNV